MSPMRGDDGAGWHPPAEPVERPEPSVEDRLMLIEMRLMALERQAG